ncbi:hypothetical protein H4582DRAFT_2129600 [Lactarius indigo]|nr:hypothetical protein H4582DRAFT_2129600 [Lactarius indigo]
MAGGTIVIRTFETNTGVTVLQYLQLRRNWPGNSQKISAPFFHPHRFPSGSRVHAFTSHFYLYLDSTRSSTAKQSTDTTPLRLSPRRRRIIRLVHASAAHVHKPCLFRYPQSLSTPKKLLQHNPTVVVVTIEAVPLGRPRVMPLPPPRLGGRCELYPTMDDPATVECNASNDGGKSDSERDDSEDEHGNVSGNISGDDNVAGGVESPSLGPSSSIELKFPTIVQATVTVFYCALM